VSRDSIVDRHWLPATDWCQRYLPCRQLASDVAENLEKVSCTECTGQGNDFEFIPRVKMETRHQIKGSFGNEFPSIYNHCEVTEAWSREALKKNCAFGKNDPLRENFQNYVPKRFTATRFDVLCSNFVKCSRREIGKVVCYLPDFVCQFSSRYCADRAQNLSGTAPDSVRRVLQIPSKSVHFRRSYIYSNVWTPSKRVRKWIQYSAET